MLDSTRAAAAALSLCASVIAQEALAPFDAPVVAFPSTTSIYATPDVDGDGRPDALGWWQYRSNEATVSLFCNDGSGDFAPVHTYAEPLVSGGNGANFDVVVGRFDGDARDDFVVRFDGSIKVWLGAGRGAPVAFAAWSEPSPFPTDLVVGDFDGDGRDDLVIGYVDRLRLLRNTGAGFVEIASAPGQATELHVIDFDADGRPDVLARIGTRFEPKLWDGVSFVALPMILHNVFRSFEASFVTSGDIDGDGDEDIAVFGSWGQYGIVRRTGPATWLVEAPVTGGPATGLADVDGDGDLDGVCCGGGGNGNSYNLYASNYEIAINDGSGRFAVSYAVPSIGGRRLGGAVDADGDGDLDLIGGRTVLWNRGQLGTAPVVPMSLTMRGSNHRVLDVDGDGDLDLESDTWQVLDPWQFHLNDGSSSFTAKAPRMPPRPSNGFYVVAGYRGDFDGDGDVDIVTAKIEDFALAGMHLLRNNGGGDFDDAGLAAPAGVNFNPTVPFYTVGPRAIVADLDGDADLDLVPSYTTTHVWLNDGSGRFTRGQALTIGYTVGAADFDGDGSQDLAVHDGDATLSILYGFGDGSFAAAVPYALNAVPHRDQIAVGDPDGDGDTDIASVATSLVLLRNDGARAFTPVVLSPLGGSNDSRRVAFADVDGDGYVDVFASPAFDSPNGSVVLFGDGRGGFPRRIVQTGTAQALLDADGDGDLDMVGTHLVRGTRYGVGDGARKQYGSSGTGLGGMAPTLGTTGPVCTGKPITTRVTGLPGGTLIAYTFALTRVELANFPLPNLVTYAYPFFATATFAASGVLGEAGTGRVEFAYTMPPATAGLVLYKQAFVLDTSLPSLFNHTNGLEVRYGRPR